MTPSRNRKKKNTKNPFDLEMSLVVLFKIPSNSLLLDPVLPKSMNSCRMRSPFFPQGLPAGGNFVGWIAVKYELLVGLYEGIFFGLPMVIYDQEKHFSKELKKYPPD